ncbi:MAG: hypothetical protein ABR915_12890, partial [Thermoguttaceae bacterium]
EAYTVWGLPCPTRDSPLVISPGFAVHELDGPAGVGLPPRVYDAYAEFHWAPWLGPRLKADVMVTPGVFSDFDNTGSQSVRVTGYGAGIWTWTPTARLVLGAAYYDRPDISVLPVGGALWKPDEETDLRLVFPKPRIAHRIYPGGIYSADVEHWLYLAGEFGGGIWAFRRSDGTDDVFSYRDYRLLLGWERKVLWGLTSQLEIGYVFGRKGQFQSAEGDFHPTDTVLLRGGLRY